MAQNIVPMRPNYQRQLRTPQHTFHLRHEAFSIQPFLLAPVRAGDSLQNMNLQCRAVTDPIKNRLIGWWLEHYFFYVRLTDLEDSADYKLMMLDAEKDMTAFQSAASTATYHHAGSIDWATECLKVVVPEYFRLEGESWNVPTINGMPAASVVKSHWTDSMRRISDFDTLDFNVDTDASTTIEASEVSAAIEKWQLMQSHGLIDMSWEDYLATFGIRTTREEEHVPELIRYTRNWQYPSNTIEPTDGSATTAVSWSIAERADKRRFFREPGFIFGCTVARPKVYFSKQTGSLADSLMSATDWLPALLHPNVQSAFKTFDNAATGPISGQDWDYVVDLRDLFLYGDQFVNFAVTATDAGMVALPTAAMQKRYPSETDTDALFVSALANNIDQDGVVSLRINSDIKDMTPETSSYTIA